MLSEFGRISQFFRNGHRMRDVSVLDEHVPLYVQSKFLK